MLLLPLMLLFLFHAVVTANITSEFNTHLKSCTYFRGLHPQTVDPSSVGYVNSLIICYVEKRWLTLMQNQKCVIQKYFGHLCMKIFVLRDLT